MTNFLFILKAIIIGIVEGVTEFLPVSSTGHMIIVENLIGFKEGVIPQSLYSKQYIDMFTMVIQLGAILAIIFLYWSKIISTFKNFWPKKSIKGFNKCNCGLKFWFNIGVACIPAGVLGVLFNDKIEEKLFYPMPVIAALIVGAVWMIYAENTYRNKAITKSIDDISVKQAFIIGCFQCLALWPGMSRSASTIIGGWICGLSTVAAAEFSFFVALPVMIGVTIISLGKHLVAVSAIQVIALGVGFIVSFIVALVVVDKFIAFLQKKPMRIFAIYRIFVGLLLLVLIFTNVVKF